MDIIISANDEIKRMMKEIHLNDDNKISPDDFQEMIIKIVQGRDEHAV